jgi:hypothetical protein
MQAQQLLREAMATRDRAARSAAHDIEGAIETSALNDSGWDKALHFVTHDVKDFLQTTGAQFLNDASLVLTIAGGILAFTPAAPLGGALLLAGGLMGAVGSGLEAWRDFENGDVAGGAWNTMWAVVGIIPVVGRLGKFGGLIGKVGGVANRLDHVGDFKQSTLFVKNSELRRLTSLSDDVKRVGKPITTKARTAGARHFIESQRRRSLEAAQVIYERENARIAERLVIRREFLKEVLQRLGPEKLLPEATEHLLGPGHSPSLPRSLDTTAGVIA